MRNLRDLPRHEFDLAGSAAGRRHALGRERSGARFGSGASKNAVADRRAGDSRTQRRVRVEADEQIGLAVVGDAPCDRRSTRRGRRRASAARARPFAIRPRPSAFARPPAPVLLFRRRPPLFAPSSSPPWPGSMTIVRIDVKFAAAPGSSDPRSGSGEAGGGGGGCADGVGSGDCAATSITRRVEVSDGRVRRLERAESRAEIERQRRGVGDADRLNDACW